MKNPGALYDTEKHISTSETKKTPNSPLGASTVAYIAPLCNNNLQKTLEMMDHYSISFFIVHEKVNELSNI